MATIARFTRNLRHFRRTSEQIHYFYKMPYFKRRRLYSRPRRFKRYTFRKTQFRRRFRRYRRRF